MKNKTKELIILISVFVITVIFTIVILLNTSKEDKQFRKDYNQLTDSKLIIKYTTANQVIEHLQNNYTGIIVYGFKNCPWCQSAVPYINDIALEKGYTEVLYLDIKDMRDNPESIEKAKYEQIFNLIKESIGDPIKIYAPTITVLKEGKITNYAVGTVDSHQKNEYNILPPMTKEQIEELKELYRTIF